jgi:hypothetical protein
MANASWRTLPWMLHKDFVAIMDLKKLNNGKEDHADPTSG